MADEMVQPLRIQFEFAKISSESILKVRTPRDYVLPSFPVGKVGILASPGGTGKSYYGLQAAFQVAAGRHCDFGLGGNGGRESDLHKVLYVSLEDEAEDIERRLGHIGAHWSKDPERKLWLHDIADAGFVQAIVLAGTGSTLVDTGGTKTRHFEEIFDLATKTKGLRLIIVDTLRRAHRCNENDNGDMSIVLSHFEQLAKVSGASVLLLHHENKSGASDDDEKMGQSAIRGASSIIDNARWAMRLKVMSKKEADGWGINFDDRRFWVKAMLEKSNYGPPQSDVWLHRGDGGVLVAKSPIPSSPLSSKVVVSAKAWGRSYD